MTDDAHATAGTVLDHGNTAHGACPGCNELLAALRAEVTMLKLERNKAETEREAWRKHSVEQDNRVGTLRDRADKAEARIARLDASIKAFLERYDALMPHVVSDRAFAQNHGIPWPEERGNWKPELDALRRAVEGK